MNNICESEKSKLEVLIQRKYSKWAFKAGSYFPGLYGHCSTVHSSKHWRRSKPKADSKLLWLLNSLVVYHRKFSHDKHDERLKNRKLYKLPLLEARKKTEDSITLRGEISRHWK